MATLTNCRTQADTHIAGHPVLFLMLRLTTFALASRLGRFLF